MALSSFKIERNNISFDDRVCVCHTLIISTTIIIIIIIRR